MNIFTVKTYHETENKRMKTENTSCTVIKFIIIIMHPTFKKLDDHATSPLFMKF